MKIKIKGGVLLDIGANIGTTCIYIAKNISESLLIYAFEPDELNYRMLSANVGLNGCKNINTYNLALSNKNTVLNMEVNLMNRGGNKIVDAENCKNTERIESVRLDDFIKNIMQEALQVRYIWMDTEGHEAYAIDGMMDILSKYHPCIFMEFTPKQYKPLDVTENDFNLLYSNLRKEYNKMIIVKNGQIHEQSIDYLKELFYKSKHQYNIFLY